MAAKKKIRHAIYRSIERVEVIGTTERHVTVKAVNSHDEPWTMTKRIFNKLYDIEV